MATYYWVGGSGTWDNTSTTNWASSSGGAGGAGVPNNTDTVNFDSNSGTAAVVDVTATAACLNGTVNKSDINLSLSGSPTFAGTLTLTAGTITLNSYTLTCLIFSSSNSNTRAIAFGTGNITLTGNAAAVLEMATVTNFTYTGTPTVNSTYSGGTGTRTIRFGNTAGATEANALNINVSSGSDIIVFAGACKNAVFTGFSGTLDNSVRSIYGNLTLSTGMTLTAGTSATTFAGTSGTQAITTNGKTLDFPVTFSGVGGTFQLQDSMTVGSTRTVTLTNGTLDLTGNSGNWTLSCGLFASSNSNARSIKFGTGNITLTGNNAGIWNLATATNFTYTGTPTVRSTYSGSTGSRTFSHGSTAGLVENNAVTLNITAGTDTIAFTANSGFANINFTGFAGTLSNSAYSIYGNLTLSTGMTITDGANATTFASASGTQTITSNGRTFSAPIGIGSATAFPTVELADALNTGTRAINVIAGTFDTKGYNLTCSSLTTLSTSAYTKSIKLNNSTVTLPNGIGFLNGANLTFDAGTSSIFVTNGFNVGVFQYYGQPLTFYNVSLTNTAARNLSLYLPLGTTTFNNLSFPDATTTSYVTLITGDIQVNGTLTLPTGSAYINRAGFYSYTGTTINAAAISGTLTDVDFRGITVTGPTAPWTGTRLGDGGGNSGITGFATPKTVYWSLAAGGNWSATAWALTSNGTPAVANYPILGDTVIFDNAGLNTSATVTLDRSIAINNLDFSVRSNAMTFATGSGLFHEVNGNFTSSSVITFSGTVTISVGGWDGTSTFTTAGRTITNLVRPSTGPNGNLIFADDYAASGAFQFTSGNINLNGKLFSLSAALASFGQALTIVNLAGATITCTGANTFQNLIGNGAFGTKTYIGTCTANCSSASAKTINNSAMADLSGFTFVNTGAGALTFTNTVTPGFTDGQYGTYGDVQTTVRPATVNFTAGQTFQFNNFTISGTSGNLVTLQSSTAGTRATLVSPNTVNSVSFCSIKDLNAVNTMGYGEWQAYTTNGNVDAGNNTGWLFSPATPSTAPRPTIRLRSLAQRGNMT